MKVNLLSLSCILFLTQLSSAKRDPFPACHGSFKRRPEICSQFNFITNPEAVQGSCMETNNGTTFYDLSELPEIAQVDPQAVKMASLITNVFEESSTSFAYAQCSDIGDSRGYTSGYVGFTTGTGDAEILIDQYAKIKPGNALSKYLDRLHEISQLPTCDRPNRGKTNGLEGYVEAWKQEACSSDQSFAHLQRQWVYENYMIPSNRYAAQNGVNSALGRAIFYDTIIQHGFQYTEPDINIVRLLALTGGRKENETEQAFLTRFLTVRRQLQCCYPDNVWPASATRSEDLQNLVDNFDYNKDLIHQIRLKNFQVNITGKEDLDLIDPRCFQK